MPSQRTLRRETLDWYAREFSDDFPLVAVIKRGDGCFVVYDGHHCAVAQSRKGVIAIHTFVPESYEDLSLTGGPFYSSSRRLEDEIKGCLEIQEKVAKEKIISIDDLRVT
ncbi:hypothetical protein HY489_00240 [Candidatus Woesearchaeota archaeon]|nr:hypothetical protein [Candidatus Woesearchaeota archaeon]